MNEERDGCEDMWRLVPAVGGPGDGRVCARASWASCCVGSTRRKACVPVCGLSVMCGMERDAVRRQPGLDRNVRVKRIAGR